MVESIDVFAEIARADGSAGWCLHGECGHDRVLRRRGLRTTSPRRCLPMACRSAGQFAPNGVAVPDGDGYRITGDFHFGSGVRHSSWVGAGVVTAPSDGSDPELRFALMPAADVRVEGELGRARPREHGQLGLLGQRRVGAVGRDLRLLCAGALPRQRGLRARRDGPHRGWARRVRDRRRAARPRRAHLIGRSKQRMGSSTALRDSERFIVELANLEARARSAASWVRERNTAAEHTALETGPCRSDRGSDRHAKRRSTPRRTAPTSFGVRISSPARTRCARRPVADLLPRHPRRRRSTSLPATSRASNSAKRCSPTDLALLQPSSGRAMLSPTGASAVSGPTTSTTALVDVVPFGAQAHATSRRAAGRAP